MTRGPGRRQLPERYTTIREALRAALRDGGLTTRELSARVGIPEKDVPGHLEHLQRSLRPSGEGLAIEPARCEGCGFAFTDRARFSKPSRCPRCKGERLSPARYGIVAAREP